MRAQLQCNNDDEASPSLQDVMTLALRLEDTQRDDSVKNKRPPPPNNATNRFRKRPNARFNNVQARQN